MHRFSAAVDLSRTAAAAFLAFFFARTQAASGVWSESSETFCAKYEMTRRLVIVLSRVLQQRSKSQPKQTGAGTSSVASGVAEVLNLHWANKQKRRHCKFVAGGLFTDLYVCHRVRTPLARRNLNVRNHPAFNAPSVSPRVGCLLRALKKKKIYRCDPHIDRERETFIGGTLFWRERAKWFLIFFFPCVF